MTFPFFNRRNSKIAFILLILFILTGLSFFDYAFRSKERTNQSIYTITKKTNENISLALNNKLDDIELVLSSMAIQIGSYEDIKNDIVMQMLYQQSIEDNYLNLSITSMDGISIDSLTNEVSSHQSEEYFLTASKGEKHLSDVFYSQQLKKQVIAMAVPIYHNDTIIGVLRSTIDLELFDDILTYSMTEDGQNAMIVQKDGNIISHTKGIISSNFFTALSESNFEDKNTLENIKTEFQNGSCGDLHYVFQSKDQLAYYCPIKDSNYMIVTVFPYKIISTQVADDYQHTIQFMVKIVVLLFVSLLFITYYERKSSKGIRIMNNQLDAIIDNTPGCLIMYEYHNHQNIKFLNDEFQNLSGYTKEEFKKFFKNDIFKIIQTDDLVALREKIHADMLNNNSKKSVSYSYRLLHKNGEYVWVMDRRHIVKDSQGKQWFYLTLLDITELKDIQERLRISQKRYEMVIEQTEFVVFEWDVQKDVISFSDLWKKKFGYELEIHDFLLFTSQNFENGSDSYLPLLEDVIRGETYGKIECKLKMKNGESIWCKITARAILDSRNYLTTVIGSIEDIDKMKSKTIMLEEKMKMDGLTGIMNKMTVESEIMKTLEAEKEYYHVLFVIDIDDFKMVNDSMGHAIGDQVLTQVGNCIKECFRNNDLMGRIGGDEFVTLMRHIDRIDESFIQQKVDNLYRAILAIKIADAPTLSVTCSIGVAFYPKDGSAYKQLFKSADEALYQAKKSGKNQCCIGKNEAS